MKHSLIFKKICLFAVAILCVLFFSLSKTTVIAQTQNSYTPLAPVPGITKGNCPDTLTATQRSTNPDCDVNATSYLPGLVKLAIQIAGALAVLMIVVGGIQYATADAITGKSAGKEKIYNAIQGLLLAIGAYVILYTVNPGILSLTLNAPANYAQPGPINTPNANPNPLNPKTPVAGTWPSAWPGGAPSPSDATIRNQLFNYIAGLPITVNANNCANVGDSGCTSLDGLSTSAINGLKALATACQQNATCGFAAPSIIITGGTEFWLHGNRSTDPSSNTTAHKPGGGAVDISKSSTALNDLIMGNPGAKNLVQGVGCTCGPRYQLGGVTYIDEKTVGNCVINTPPHWHICYGP